MGDDELAIVDDRLRVHDTEGLRVVDASVMPSVISGGPNATAITIAEKAADFIKSDRRHESSSRWLNPSRTRT